MSACPRRREIGQRADPKADDVEGDRCTYCGSMSPDAFFAAIEAGAEIVGTDKNYKVYVRPGAGEQHKFYFQHLDEAGQRRFIDLHNAKKIEYEPMFGLYTKPFFFA